MLHVLMLLAALGAWAACGHGDQGYAPGRVREVRDVSARAIRRAIVARLRQRAPAGVSADDWRRTRAVYRMYDDAPLWLEEKGAGDRVEALERAVATAPDHALDPAPYPRARMEQVAKSIDDLDHPTAAQLADADVAFTAAYTALAHDLLVGQVSPRSVSQSWYIDPAPARVDSVIGATLRAPELDKAVEALAPQSPEYAALQHDLARYRKIVQAGGWQPVPEGKELHPGDTADPRRLAALVARLRAEQIAPDSMRAGRTYDAALAGAVARFQELHTIEPDSVLGAKTVEAMNVPADYRLRQIAANLERHRWLPRTLGSRFVLVNVPAFELYAYDSGRAVLTMRVVVGAEYEGRATPVFSDSMQYVVFRPYWYVPDSIAAREIYPKADADPDYMTRNGYEVVDEEGEERVRQQPGPDNALGLVKFIFPNDFAIYLHDTPAKSLFEQADRGASHGCVRVQHPVQLAEFALGWPEARVRDAMEHGADNHRVDLPRKLPVYIVYFTTFTRNGALHFGDDLYDRDNALVRAVAAGATPGRIPPVASGVGGGAPPGGGTGGLPARDAPGG
ncbi:MAG TPA: L,D-transpeptidase family protein [Gemmatimonadaceae bacterium]|nr:L,D-transpeptidase family protein [Gemmatimonadaceae bacterium]